MKNIEKIAIDTIISQFSTKNNEIIQATISAKAAAETASANFKKAAGPLINMAKESASVLLQDQVSDEAIKYFEERIADTIKIPFKLQG